MNQANEPAQASSALGDGGYRLDSPVEVLHRHYRELFLDARQDRSRIRGSLATPVAATAFSVFNLATVVQYFDVGRIGEPVGLAIALLTLISVLALLGAVVCMIKAEWGFVHIEPPDLPEIARIEETIRGAHSGLHDPERRSAAVSAELQNLLTGSYYVGYEDLLIGNMRSSSQRTWALRLVLAALAGIAVALLLLPFHVGAPPAAGG